MTYNQGLSLVTLPKVMAICQLDASARVPGWACGPDFFSVTRTRDELSIVCPAANVPEGTRCEKGWRCLKVQGPLDFSLTGILASLAGPLAHAGIAIFVVSTYATDYLLIRERDVELAVQVLAENGHEVECPSYTQPTDGQPGT